MIFIHQTIFYFLEEFRYLAKCFFAVHDRENALNALELAVEYASDFAEYADLKRKAIKAKNLLLDF